MRYLLLSACFLLAACGDSAEVKHAKWMAFCTSHEFSDKQCEVLEVLKIGNEEAANNAQAAAIGAGVAVGMAAGASAGRR